MDAVFENCAQYARIGVAADFVFNPRTHTAWEWDTNTKNLERLDCLKLENGAVVEMAALWSEMERDGAETTAWPGRPVTSAKIGPLSWT